VRRDRSQICVDHWSGGVIWRVTFIKFELNDKSMLSKITILTELRKSNTQQIVNFKVLYFAQ